MAQARLDRQNVTDSIISLDWSHHLTAHIDCVDYLKARYGPDVQTDKPLFFSVMGGTNNQAGAKRCFCLSRALASPLSHMLRQMRRRCTADFGV